ncbi:MAG: hypothetical protein H0X65_19665 [Gemmatimonadetes bacterium]|nr:hypothetical protein [Gemmatimonadota bacterium]
MKGQAGDLFLSKISGMFVELGELDAEGNVPVVQVARRLADSLDVERVTREQVRSTFREELRDLLERIIPAELRVSGWHHPNLARGGHYPVDWYVQAKDIPLCIFALTTKDKVKDATITLHQFEKWEVPHRTVGIFQDQQDISRKTLARFTDVAEKNFSVLSENADRIHQYIRQAVPN